MTSRDGLNSSRHVQGAVGNGFKEIEKKQLQTAMCTQAAEPSCAQVTPEETGYKMTIRVRSHDILVT